MNIHFILVAPQLPENVGAAARALNTMGFDHLRLVTPCDFLSQRARWMAHGSEHLLEQAAVYETFADAIADLDFIVGATARRRGKRQEYFSGEELPGLLVGKKGIAQNVGIVFGREDRGLLNDEIARCDALVALNMRAPYPSLNLAQAVMVFAYILSPLALHVNREKPTKPQAGEFHWLKNRVAALLQDIGFASNSNIVNRLLERMGYLSEEDVRMLHSVIAKLERKITRQGDV